MTAPFGVELNTPLDMSLVVSDLGGDKFAISPAKPHPSFETFIAEDIKRYGVVWLKGIGKTIENDSYGSGVQHDFAQLSSQLSSRYGMPREVDVLKVGALWTEPREWISSILQKERIFFHIWEREAGSTLPDDIENVFLGITAYSSSDASLSLEYSSSKMNAAELDSQNDFSDLL